MSCACVRFPFLKSSITILRYARFRPLSEIQENIRANEGLRAVIGQDLCDALCASDDSNHAEALRLAFTSLMSTKKEDLQGPLESHKAKVSSKAAKDPLDELFLRLWEQGQDSKERNDMY